MTRARFYRLAALVAALGAAAVVAVSAGTAATASKASAGKAAAGITIAFNMPCSTCASRFEEQDKPDFVNAVHKLNPSVKVIATNAQGSDATQISQIQDALANGAKVIVISPLDESTGKAVVLKAAKYHVPVIAYDGLLTGAKIAFYVSFDNKKVGALQGQYLVSHLKSGATVAMINGDQTSDPGVQFKQGALSVLQPAFDSGKLKLGYSVDTPLWNPATATTEMQQALTKLNNDVQGVLSPNDGIAGGVIAALKSQQLDGKVVITGQDATTAGLQSILEGTQAMTVFKPISLEAAAAAKVSVGLATGNKAIVSTVAKTKVNNKAGNVPSLLLQPMVVTKANVSVVVKSGAAKWKDICSGLPSNICPTK
ncbi:MAG TPA: substrate-binding domain-containing protein [Gaiellaceae bacterium]|nr:substrate-binding domain-containing protein [Gaiellaceae bacterium]